MKIRLKRTLQPYLEDGKIIFGFGNSKLTRSIEDTSLNRDLIYKLDGGIDLKDQSSQVDEWLSQGLLTTNVYDDSKFSRNVNFFEWVDRTSNLDPSVYQKRLEQSRVLIVGVGGIGSTVVEILARLGVGNFVIMDFDTVEESNLTRQSSFKKSDLGKYKVDVVAEYIELISDAKVEKINGKLEKKADLDDIFSTRDIDIAICCADTPKIEVDFWFDDVCHKYNVPFIVGSYASTVVNYLHIVPNKTTSLRTFYEQCLISDEHLLETSVPMSVIAPISYLSASIIAYKIFDSLTGLIGTTDSLQIDCIDWTVVTYDEEQEHLSE